MKLCSERMGLKILHANSEQAKVIYCVWFKCKNPVSPVYLGPESRWIKLVGGVKWTETQARDEPTNSYGLLWVKNGQRSWTQVLELEVAQFSPE